MKIIQIVGARPQFVKLAPLSRELRKRHQELIIHSGQHFDIEMNELFFRDLEIPTPDYNLGIGSGGHGVQTGEILAALEPLLIKEQPDLAVVYGDTNTTLAGALAAVKLGIPTAHVEAGLRSFNRTMPEEINRVVSDHICDLLLAPTPTAVANATREGLESKCRLVGDIMVDSLKFGVAKAKGKSTALQNHHLEVNTYSLLTLHRPYNVDDPEGLFKIMKGLESLNQPIIFPVHPRTRKVIASMPHYDFKNITFIAPQGYLDFLALLQGARMVITDSGGIQKEAYILEKPCVTLRPETEWAETVNSGWNLLLPVESELFPQAIRAFQVPEQHPDIFGRDVAKRIGTLLESLVSGRKS